MIRVQVLVNSLNRRKYPVTDFSDKTNVIGIMNKGYVFEAVGEVTNALGKWYVDKEGYCAWEKGLGNVLLKADLDIAGLSAGNQLDSSKMSWGHQFCDIPSIWKGYKTYGEGVTVAVLDTGIHTSHPDLIMNLLPSSKNVMDDSDSVEDADGHGTHMAGIIAGAGMSKVFGVAPRAKLLVVKATEMGMQDDLAGFIKAAEYVSSVPEVDIVSVSYAFNCSDYDKPCHQAVDNFEKAIQKCIDSNKIVLGSIGDYHYPDPNHPNETDRDTYPACFNNGRPFKKGVLAVGAFGRNGELCSFSQRNVHISFVAPGDNSVLTTGLNGSLDMGKKTSIATAFSAGCLALLLSYIKQQGQPIDILKCVDTVLTTCDSFGDGDSIKYGSGYGRLNLVRAFEKVKTFTP